MLTWAVLIGSFTLIPAVDILFSPVFWLLSIGGKDQIAQLCVASLAVLLFFSLFFYFLFIYYIKFFIFTFFKGY
jgi:hypothetical protein